MLNILEQKKINNNKPFKMYTKHYFKYFINTQFGHAFGINIVCIISTSGTTICKTRINKFYFVFTILLLLAPSNKIILKKKC